MSRDKTGGPAFPKLTQDERWKTFQSTEGMTLRDYFAAKALQGMSADIEDEARAARWCYEIADAMLEARKA